MRPLLPWQRGESILDAVRAWDGSSDAAFVLPDEPPPDPTELRRGAGTLDGIAGRHFAVGEDAGAPAEIVRRLRRLQ